MVFYIGIEAELIYEAGSLLRKRKNECESGVRCYSFYDKFQQAE